MEGLTLQPVHEYCGLYIHIPFCKQACTYCNFHFSTSLHYVDQMIDSIIHEMEIRAEQWPYDRINTIYFGGGTPSILEARHYKKLFKAISRHFSLSKGAEVTLEANPDDIIESKLQILKEETPVNRLSIGIQSFDDEDLQFMHRSHNAKEGFKSIELSKAYDFDLLTVDLIYGSPGTTDEQWLSNLSKIKKLGLNHLSAYQLTVEPKTALAHGISKGTFAPVIDEKGRRQFDMLMDWCRDEGWVHYEISNLAAGEAHIARHNTSYWQGVPYLGLGPSAHSFNDRTRMWNIANNVKYMKAIGAGKWPGQWEILTDTEQYNEWVMTSLRTMWGIETDSVHAFPSECYEEFIKGIPQFLEEGLLSQNDGRIFLTRDGRHMADRIASELMVVS